MNEKDEKIKNFKSETKSETKLSNKSDDIELQVQERANKILNSKERLKSYYQYNRELIEVSIDPFVTIGLDGKLRDVNKAVELVTGYSRDQLIGTDFSDYFIRPDQAKAGYETVFREGYVKDYPLEIQHKNGHITPVLYNASIYKDQKGKTIGVFAAARDITERKIAEKALIESQQRLSDFIDFLPDATLAIDVDGKVIAWNQAIEEMTGFKADDILGKGDYEYSLPFYGTRRPMLIDLVLKSNRKIENFYRYVKRDKTALLAEADVELNNKNFILWVKAVPLYDSDGNINGAVESIRDITKPKMAKSALKRSEQRFRAVAESAVDAIVTTNSKGNIIFFNNSLTKIFGYSKEELSGKPLTLLMPERYKKIYLNELQKFKKSGQHRLMGKTVTTTGLKKDNNEFPFEMSLSAWVSDGKTYFTSIIRDLTERQKADEQIKKSLQEKEVLIREVHHRVKNNMQIISSLLNLQTRYVDDKETVNLLKESQNRVKSMAMIHEKLYQSHDLNHINIYDYINSLVKDLFYSYAIPKNQIIPVIEVEEINLNIETAVPCGLIISEIISNSLKYAFPGGREGEVHISLKHKGEKFYLIIGDNGIGLPESIDFNNTDSLGLKLVNSLTEQIDGELELDRSQGTKFNITFQELKYKERS